MSKYDLFLNETAVRTTPVNVIQPFGQPNPNMPPEKQTFQLVVTASAGAASGSAQIVVSNDGENWISYGDPIEAASTYLTAQAQSQGSAAWKYFGAYLTAISGTNAYADLTMAA